MDVHCTHTGACTHRLPRSALIAGTDWGIHRTYVLSESTPLDYIVIKHCAHIPKYAHSHIQHYTITVQQYIIHTKGKSLVKRPEWLGMLIIPAHSLSIQTLQSLSAAIVTRRRLKAAETSTLKLSWLISN